jgi:insulysin
VTHLEPLTKSDIVTFYNHYIHPASPTRSKLAIHLLAQTSPAEVAESLTPEQQKEKIVQMATQFLVAQDVVVEEEPLGKRFESVDVSTGETEGLVKALEGYLAEDAKLPKEKVDSVAAEAKVLLATALPALGIEVKKPTFTRSRS